MSGAHIPIMEKMSKKIKEKRLEDKIIVIGGVVPSKDIPKLKELGANAVFPGGTPFLEIISFLKENVKK